MNYNQLRYEYDLTPESVVIDGGTYEGEFAKTIYAIYACPVEMYEPIPEFHQLCLNVLHKNPPLKLFKKGIGNSNRKEHFKYADNMTGQFALGKDIEVDIADIKDIIGTRHIDLLKLNVEGMEYEILERIIECDLQKQIENIQVQFHIVEGKSNNYTFNFIKEGDLVFDVGANVGEKSALFKSLGAKVVAFEPQDICYNYLTKLGIDIETIALSEEKGLKHMFLCSADTLSSMSPEFISKVKEERFKDYNWDEEVLVKADTLDNMIEKYGVPKFIKIDVEGYELEVLKGLTQKVPYISIEFTPELIERTIKCLELYPDSLFNYSSRAFNLFVRDWQTKDSFIEYLKTMKDERDEFGDIYINNLGKAEDDYENVSNYMLRYEKIREKLLETHELTYDYPFIWQNFRLKNKSIV